MRIVVQISEGRILGSAIRSSSCKSERANSTFIFWETGITELNLLPGVVVATPKANVVSGATAVAASTTSMGRISELIGCKECNEYYRWKEKKQ